MVAAKCSIVWFRQDLRIADQPTLIAAIQRNQPVIPLFIWEPKEYEKWSPGAASKWWLHFSLISLEKELCKLGLELIVRTGSAIKNLLEISKEANVDLVYWNRCYEPALIDRDASIQAHLKKENIHVQIFNGSLLYQPWEILNKQSKPFKIFTPFWKSCLNTGNIETPLDLPASAPPCHTKLKSLPISSLDLLPHIHWDTGLKESWQPGTSNALNQLKFALKQVIPFYIPDRDRPDKPGTSQLSPYLHFGEISPRMIWQAVMAEKHLEMTQKEAFLRQLGWREFGYYLLYHFPNTTDAPLYDKYAAMPWLGNQPGLESWQKGLTGYPIVDAGMRQLWRTGWMHNRVRMIVGSFLVKDLLIHWKEGAKWFWDTLVDADLANNTLGWQWIGGCGADAAPYYRVFNPVLQGKKFDPEGEYVKKWVPELKLLPKKWVHQPWDAPNDVLKHAEVELGKSYPYPIIDHGFARLRALEAFKILNRGQ